MHMLMQCPMSQYTVPVYKRKAYHWPGVRGAGGGPVG